MNWQAIIAIIIKDLNVIRRNQYMLAGLLVPILLAFTVRVMLGSDNNLPAVIKIGIVSPEQSKATTFLQSIPNLDVLSLENIPSNDEVDSLSLDGFIVVPNDISAALSAEIPVSINAFINRERSFQVQNSIQDIVIVLSQYFEPSKPLVKTTFESIGLSEEGSPIENFDKYLQLLVMVSTPCLIGILIVPLLLVEEKEKRTDRFLLTSIASSTDIFVSKIITGLFLCSLFSLLVLTIADPSYLTLVVINLIILTAAYVVGFGILMGVFLESSMQVNAWASILLMYLLAPLFSPFINFPPLAWLSRINPTFYVREILLDVSKSPPLINWCILIIIIGVVFLYGQSSFKKYVEHM